MAIPKTWEDAVRGLHHGAFSYLEPLFEENRSSERGRCRIIEWFEEGRFANDPKALAEALSCACFLGKTNVAEFLLDKGVDPAAGNGTGLNAFHWAANRGNLETVRLLIKRGAPLEIENMYGGTVLDCTVWSSLFEPCADHVSIIEALINAGAKVDHVAAEWLAPDLHPPLDPRIIDMLRRAVEKRNQ